MSKSRVLLSSPRADEIKRKKKKVLLRNIILSTLLFVALVFGLSFLSSSEKISINEVKVIGTRIINEKDILEVVDKNISGKYLYLFSKSNSFIYPKNKIYKNLKNDFTRIEKLSIDIDNVNTLIVTLSERSGSYMWCGDYAPKGAADEGDNCFFINDNGYIFDKAPYFSGNLYFKYYKPISQKGNVLGVEVMDSQKFSDTVRLIEGIKNVGLNPISMAMSSDGDNWFVYLKSAGLNQNPRLVFRYDADLAKVLEDLTLAMKEEQFKDEIYKNYDTLSYIDLRFKNRVFYKFNSDDSLPDIPL
jgi:hypothetical protein